MIDTIKLSYPASDYLYKLFTQYAERVQKISPDGEVLWEKAVCQTSLPSHFSGLRITYQNIDDLIAAGFNPADKMSQIQFEFSLQKWQSETAYNNVNTDLVHDLLKLEEWIYSVSETFNYSFDRELFQLYRIDLSQNLILESGSVDDFLRALELKFSRHPNGQQKLMRFDGALQYASRWIGKKIYSKWKEFEHVERKKHRGLYLVDGSAKVNNINGKRPLTESEQMELVRMLRVEVEFRRTFLKKYGHTKIASIPELLARFEEEKAKFLTVKKLREGITLSNAEYKAVDLCKRYGYEAGYQEFIKESSRATWFRVKKNLLHKSVDLTCILNADWRLDIEKADAIPDFILRVA